MILSANRGQFYLRFPENFISKEVIDRYDKYLQSYPTTFKSMNELINHTIQKVTLPKINIDVTRQQPTGAKIAPVHRKGMNALREIDRSFSVTFKHVEGFLSYFLFLESIVDVNGHTVRDPYLPDLMVTILNAEKQQLYKVAFKQVLYKGFGETFELSYTDVRNTKEYFTVEFAYNDISLVFDGEEIYD